MKGQTVLFYICVFYFFDLKKMVLFNGLEKALAFLIPIIHLPFVDDNRRMQKRGRNRMTPPSICFRSVSENT